MIEQLTPLFFPLCSVRKKDNSPFLGIQTQVKPTSLKGIGLAKLAKGNGWYITPGKTESWPTRGFDQWDDQLIALCPLPAGFDPLNWKTGPREDRILGLRVMARTFATLLREGNLPDHVSPWNYFPGRNGDCLVLHDSLVRGLEGIFPLQLSQDSWAYVHPDFHGLESHTFFLASNLWALLGGKSPFEATEITVAHTNIRETILPKANSLFPSLEPELCRLLDQTFGKKNTGSPSLSDWVRALETPWDEQDPTLSAVKQDQHMAQDSKRRKFFTYLRKNRLPLIGGGLFLVFAAFFFGSWIIDMQVKNPYLDLKPQDVVQAYYQGFDELNDRVMRRLNLPLETPPFAREDIDIVTQIYIFSVTKETTMGEIALIRAKDWAKNREIELPEGLVVWGLLDLKITAQSPVVFDISYTLVYSYTDRGERIWETYRHLDTMRLLQDDRNGWKIRTLTRNREYIEIVPDLQ